MFGALREEVDAAVDSYLRTRSPKRIVTDMMMSAWNEANHGDVEDARQTLNRVKVTIQRFYTGEERGFFGDPEGEAYSYLSDAQEMLAQDDIIRAKMCIDEAWNRVFEGLKIPGSIQH
jgi:hypothetical protein